MAYSLFYAEHSAAMGVRVLLEELGVPYDTEMVSIRRRDGSGDPLVQGTYWLHTPGATGGRRLVITR